jgi:DNA-binding NarL/FixJ family response regulator
VVFLTVHDEEDLIIAAKAAGGTGYVVKPRLVSDLMRAINDAVAGREFVSPHH